jgi:colanic acid biosynthesis protein WcaH
MNLIPKKTYRNIVDAMPILCVDAIIRNDQGQVLLVKRTNEPLKGEWWVPGGRVYKGEGLEDSIQRKIKEELGIDINIKGVAGYYEDQFEKNPLNIASGLHTLGIVFEVTPENLDIQLDNQSGGWDFFDKLPTRLVIKPFMPSTASSK